MARPAPARHTAALGLLTVLAANALYLAGMTRALDVPLSTDPYYIRLAGEPLAALGRLDPAWGPLYPLWLKPLRLLFGDPVAVALANVAALSVAGGVLLYAYVLRLTGRAAPATAAALAFLISDANVPLENKVALFAALLALAGLLAAAWAPPGARALAAASAGALLAGYARPELYPAGVLLALAAAWRARHEASRARAWAFAALALAALLALAAGVPGGGTGGDGDRLLVAFREHFAWNWNRWQAASAPTEGWLPYDVAWQASFGSADGVWAALRANPAAVLRHLADNAAGSVRLLVPAAFDHAPLLAPATAPALVRVENGLAAVAALGVLAWVAARPALRRRWQAAWRGTLAPAAVLAALPLAAAALIYPVIHYLMVPIVLLLVATALAAALLLPPAPVSRRLALVAALACLAAIPQPFAGAAAARPTVDTVTFIRALALPPPVRVLTFTDGLGDLLGPGFEEVKVWQKPPAQAFAEYLRARDVTLIFTADAGKHSFLLDDPHWRRIQEDPPASGYTQLGVPTAPRVRLYLRADLAAALPSRAPQHTAP